jgi:hypothetical protein
MRGAEPILIAVLMLGSLAIAGAALGNGRSPPRPAGTAILTAVCEPRGGGERLEMVRPRLAAPAMPEGALLVRSEGAFAPIHLDLIRRIEINDGATPDDDGAVAVQLYRADGGPEAGGAARVKLLADDKTPVKLRGFSRDGARVETDLAQCRRLDFAVVGEGPVDRPPLGAKAD